MEENGSSFKSLLINSTKEQKQDPSSIKKNSQYCTKKTYQKAVRVFAAQVEESESRSPAGGTENSDPE